ncbi:MAG: DUF4229 domain-containing protein [Frankiaceae bacterium]|jgi:hypothetical protein|nr:DUF4229 domain-containing protein [Frankiaceae bacterium]
MAGSRPVRIMGLFWMYTGLRAALFAVLFGGLWLVGVRGWFGLLVALVLGIPASIYVLATPRARLAAALQDHVDARGEHQAQLRRRLGGDQPDADQLDAGRLDGSHEAIDAADTEAPADPDDR